MLAVSWASVSISAVQPGTSVAQDRSGTPIILISVDTLRADHLSCYGSKGPSTNHIDQLAAGGTIFEQVNSQIPLTLPSHVSLLTSTYPFINGVEDNDERLAPNAITLARVLKSHGYRTAAFVGGFVLDRRFGLDQGFDVYDSPSSPRMPPGKDPGDIKRFGEDVTRAASQWLERNTNQPFFLFIHLYDLHTPYRLPVSERTRHLGYEGELGYVDEVLGRFWNVLEKQGLIHRALVVFISDHGESLQEHGESTHGYFAYQSTLRVPLIIHWPRQPSSFASRFAEPVSLLDVAPTLLQFVGFTPPAGFQGRNLLALISKPQAPAAGASVQEEIYSESIYPHLHFGTSGLRALRIGRYKYIQSPRPEFYDLLQDPAEKQNLYGNRKPMALDFRKRLDLLRVRASAKHTSAPATPQPDVAEQLRSLGYVGSDAARHSTFDSGADPKDRITDYEEYGRAIALADAGHLTASNTVLEQLLDKHIDVPDLHLSLGLNQQKLGHQAEAAEEFEAVLKQNSRSAIAHFNRALSMRVLGRQAEAVRELEATLVIDPYYSRAEEMLASLYLDAKNYDKARSHLNHLIELDPTSYTANYNLGTLDCLQGNWRDGDRHLRAAIAADPASAEAHNTLGSLHLLLGDREAARTEFVEAIRLDPHFASAHYNLGMIFRQQNKIEEAVREFRNALSGDPQFRPAREALNRLGASTTAQNK